jgi:2-phosphoglycolate phosphatase
MIGVGAVLFDLDGTLLDTAPDLTRALNRVLVEQGRAPLPPASVRPYVSHGTRGLLRVGFDMTPDEPGADALRQRMLEVYAQGLADTTRPFPGILDLLEGLERAAIPWGVVTNKPERFTAPLLELLGLARRASVVVGGDTVEQSKPHPAPLLHAARRISMDPGRCVYIGDAQRDIEAGRRAGMRTLAVLYGYLGDDDRPHEWGADGVIHTPAEVLDWIELGNGG